MKSKKVKSSIIALTFLLTIILNQNISFAAEYVCDSYNELDPFGYGLEFLSYAGVKEYPGGAYQDVIGVLNRCRIYRNNIKVLDESKTGYHSAKINGSLSSPNYSNSWRILTETSIKEEGDTYYKLILGIENTKSN